MEPKSSESQARTSTVDPTEASASSRLLLAVAAASAEIARTGAIGAHWDRALAILGESAGYARVYILENAGPSGEETATCPLQWAASGILNLKRLPGAYPVPYASFSPWIVDALRNGIPAEFDVVREAEARSAHLERMGADVELKPARVLAVPIHVQGGWWGCLAFDSLKDTTAFNSHDVAALRSLAATMGSVLERERAERERLDAERKRSALLGSINRAALLLLSSGDFDAAMDRALAEFGEALDIGRAVVGVIGPPDETSTVGTLTWRWEWASDGVASILDDPALRSFPLDQQPDIYEKAKADEIILIEDHALREGVDTDQAYQKAAGAGASFTVPIFDGAVFWGAISGDAGSPREWNEAEISAVRLVAAAIGGAAGKARENAARLDAERARAEESLRTTRHLQAVAAGSRRLVDANDFEAALLDWLVEMGRAAGAERATYHDVVVHSESGLKTFRGLAKWSAAGVADSIATWFEQPVVIDPRGAEDLTAAVLDGRIAVFQADEASGQVRDFLEAQGTATVLTVPIVMDGETRFVLSLDYLKRRDLTDSERTVLQTASDSLVGVLKRREAEQARLSAERARAEFAESAAAVLGRRSELLEAVVAASDAFLRAQSLKDAADAVVERIGRAMGVDRSLVGRFLPPDAKSDAGWYETLYEWTTPTTPRQMDDPALRVIDMARYADFHTPLKAGQPVAIVTEDIADPVARAEQEATGVLSQYQYPIMVDGALWGAIGADDCTRPRRFDEAEIATLRLVASAIGSLVKREQLVAARLEAERELAAEKSRMAREIHDTLAQGFTGVIMQLHAAEDALDAADVPDASRHTARALDRARMGLSEARRSVYALRPPMLDDGDLAGALRVLMSRVFDGVPVKHDLVVVGEGGVLSEAVLVEVFRIAQEAIGNAIRHAGANSVTVLLDWSHLEEVTLAVADDGDGFDPDAPGPQPGFGLVSMRERAKRLGGRLSITSAPRRGSEVRVTSRRDAGAPFVSTTLPGAGS